MTFLLLLSTVFLAGCWSFRCKGTSSNVERKESITKQKYRIDKLKFRFPEDDIGTWEQGKYISIEDFGVVAKAWNKNKGNLQEKIMAHKPDVFSTDASAVPISVYVNCQFKRKGGGVTGWGFLASCFIIPCFNSNLESCAVTVQLSEQPLVKHTFNTIFQYNQKVSIIGPMGLIPFNDDYRATVCKRSASQTEVFAETMAISIGKLLEDMEREHEALNGTLPTPPAPKPQTDNTVETLRSLRDSGAITQQEFEQMLLRNAKQ